MALDPLSPTDDPAPAAAKPVPAPAAPASPANPATPGAASPNPVNFDSGEAWPTEGVTLAHPFVFAGQTYTGYSFRTASGAEMITFMSGNLTTVDLAGMLSGLSAPVMQHMHGADFRGLVRRVADFL